METEETIVESTDQLDNTPEAPETGTEQDETIQIDDATYSVAEVKELLSKGKDYTEKTQALADERREIEEQKQIVEVFGDFMAALNDPSRVQEAIDWVQQAASKTLGQPYQGADGIDLEDPTENESILYKQVTTAHQQMAAMRAEVQQLKAALADLQPILQETTQAKQDAANVSRVKASLNVDVTPAQIKEAMKATGVADPVGAIAVMIQKKGLTAGGKEPPKTPKSETRSATLASNDPDALFAQLQGKSQRRVP